MHQEFNAKKKVHVNRDEKGIVRDLLHTEEPFVSDAPTPQLAAAEYLKQYGDLLGIRSEETKALGLTRGKVPEEAGSELRFHSEKRQFDTTTVTYEQTYLGLPVWHGGVSIQLKDEAGGMAAGKAAARKGFRVIGSQSTRHADLEVKKPSKAALEKVQKITKETLVKQLGLTPKQKVFNEKTLAIERVQLIIYQYLAAKRESREEPPSGPAKLRHLRVTLPLPPVPQSIQEGRHYVSAEVYFTLAVEGTGELHWVAILDAESLTVLFLRAFIADVNGMVFRIEPMTDNGGPMPGATSASLNPVRTSELLDGLTAPSSGSNQALTGTRIQIYDIEAPHVASPTEPAGTDFNFDARTNDFAAVNAYYHCHQFFRMMAGMGFDITSYFGSTSFPIPVDHRGRADTANGIEINGYCEGNGMSGISGLGFMLADLSDTSHPLGLACDYRVVLHELGGHGVLYPHVNFPNFGFSHSAGDSIAAITCDPDSHAYNTANPADPARFLTFPWMGGVIDRRHDRSVTSGWAWGGTEDNGGYDSEQILCTTLFRFYRAIRGDSPYMNDRLFAARYAVYLILRAIATLTPATNPGNAAGFATALMNADLGDWTSEGHAGGAYGKVIRWTFEKQGLYQPAGAPVPVRREGAPPEVDVYIDDGRHGEYQYQPNHWSCQAIWNRRHSDGRTTHEEPVVDTTNYAYVKLKNRGTKKATNVVVKAYHAKPGMGLVYPNDWQPMTTAELAAADVPPNSSAEITVGPFEWIPSQVGHECMFMVASALGDPSNLSNMTAGDAIPEWRLVPNDNNIGQRNVFPVPGGGGAKDLVKALNGLEIRVRNPHRVLSRTFIEAVLPKFLEKKGWKLTFSNPGGGAFALKAGAIKTVVLSLKPGEEFTAGEVRKAKDAVIQIRAIVNGMVVGGMSYRLDPKMKKPAG